MGQVRQPVDPLIFTSLIVEFIIYKFDPPIIPTKTIPDPEVKKPGPKDERAKIPELDTAPKFDSPKCVKAPGCGEWKRTMKRNPAYKGKLHPPLTNDPNYKGILKPLQMPNPHYFEIDKLDFKPIATCSIEIGQHKMVYCLTTF
ncbi:Calreticulin/calnexin [Dillenia turbinata]|uniref:Calreticulin/calnexin n=1 Tax=Dillenia turbinata TaxID=194707 RepID=A0AAN8UY22_9MAGN